MHILTKILVVFAAVLSLVLAALTSSYAMDRDTITSSYNDAVARRDKAESNYETQSSQFAEERQALQQQGSMLNAQLSRLQGTNRESESKIAELRLKARSAEDRADSFTGQIFDLGKTVDTQAELITSYRSEVGELRTDALTTREQNIALLDRLSDLESQNEVLIQSNRSLLVSIAELQQLDGGSGDSADSDGTPRILGGDVVRGSVRQVSMDNGQQYAEVDLGTRDRMQKNVKLHITRNGEFVANLILVETDLQSSVGLVDTIGDNSVVVRQGDTVLSSLTRN